MNEIVSATDPKAEGMLCPVCKIDLLLSDRQGIEIDYCPQCRGVWLDRGELDKIIERNLTYGVSGPEPSDRLVQGQVNSPWDNHGRGEGGHHGQGKHGGRRRRGFLGGLFDH